jgi:hypothetical protein
MLKKWSMVDVPYLQLEMIYSCEKYGGFHGCSVSTIDLLEGKPLTVNPY